MFPAQPSRFLSCVSSSRSDVRVRKASLSLVQTRSSVCARERCCPHAPWPRPSVSQTWPAPSVCPWPAPAPATSPALRPRPIVPSCPHHPPRAHHQRHPSRPCPAPKTSRVSQQPNHPSTRRWQSTTGQSTRSSPHSTSSASAVSPPPLRPESAFGLTDRCDPRSCSGAWHSRTKQLSHRRTHASGKDLHQ